MIHPDPSIPDNCAAELIEIQREGTRVWRKDLQEQLDAERRKVTELASRLDATRDQVERLDASRRVWRFLAIVFVSLLFVAVFGCNRAAQRESSFAAAFGTSDAALEGAGTSTEKAETRREVAQDAAGKTEAILTGGAKPAAPGRPVTVPAAPLPAGERAQAHANNSVVIDQLAAQQTDLADAKGSLVTAQRSNATLKKDFEGERAAHAADLDHWYVRWGRWVDHTLFTLKVLLVVAVVLKLLSVFPGVGMIPGLVGTGVGGILSKVASTIFGAMTLGGSLFDNVLSHLHARAAIRAAAAAAAAAVTPNPAAGQGAAAHV